MPMLTPPLSVPLTPDVGPQLISFKRERKSFTVHNASPKPRETMFAGNLMTIPAVHEVHPLKTDTDADGEPIPGTYVVEDVYTYFEALNDEILTMNAERAVIHVLGIRRRSDGTASELSSPHAISGLSLLPRHATKQVWRMVAQAGEQRAFLAAVEHARTTIAAWDVANSKRKAAGMEAIEGGVEYDYARSLIAQYNQLMRGKTAEVTQPYRAQAEVDETEQELEFLTFMKAKVQGLVDKVATKQAVDKKQLFDEMMQDPDVRRHAQKQFRFRQKGHMPVPDEDLDRAAEAGLRVDEINRQDRGEV